MFKKLGLYYRTIKHLKTIQIRYQLWYRLRDKIRKLTGHSYPLSISRQGNALNLEESIPSPVAGHPSVKTFSFLNQSHTFKESIDWNYKEYGKLWTYNLNYFDYLQQERMSREKGLELIGFFIDAIEDNREGMEPYPISLRAMNWIKFFSRHKINDEEIAASLYAQYRILMDNLEYHLLGNHLLENGFSLLFGAFYFRDEELYEQAWTILVDQLQEQILADGGHFERSTMYHCILLERLMDCINIADNNREWKDDKDFRIFLQKNAERMLGWMEEMTVDGRSDRRPKTVDRQQSSVIRHLPLLNDAAKGIGPKPSELFNYANRLELDAADTVLGDSGYRSYSSGNLDLICDVGEVGPDYQPGHAHSDTLSFVLYSEGEPVIIDPGISTYENNERRIRERSTSFHNTVQYGDYEQSEVWSAFRMGRRASIIRREERKEDDAITLIAAHDGYSPWGVVHQRSWHIDNSSNKIRIEDTLEGANELGGIFYLHFHPRLVNKIKVFECIARTEMIQITFEGVEEIDLQTYDCPDGYNQYIKAPKLRVIFKNELVTRIHKIDRIQSS